MRSNYLLRKTLNLLAFLALPLFVASQPDFPSRLEREKLSAELLNDAPYIFEGIVKEWNFIYDDLQDRIFTSYRIEVKNVLKGSIVEKEISLIKPGGQIGDDIQYLVHDPYPNTGAGDWYIFLCKENEFQNMKKNLSPHTYNYFVPGKRSLIYKNPLYNAKIRYYHPDGDNMEFFGLEKLGFKDQAELTAFLTKNIGKKTEG